MVGPDYEAPEIQAPEAWRTAAPDNAASIANQSWWEVFHDEDLQNLIQVALEENKDLKMALARLDQARAAIGVTDAAFLPSIDYSGGYQRTRSHTGANPGTPRHDRYSLGGTVNWEIDLWGRIRRLSESAEAQYLSVEENKNAVVLALVAETASSYFRLRMLDAQLAITEHTAKTRVDAYKLALAKLEAGTKSEIETFQFEADMLSAQAAISQFKQGIAIQENALSVLLGRNPGEIIRDRSTPTPFLAEIPAGIPAEILLRRPDIRAAGQQIRAANAEIGAAVANYFPTVSLTGALGFINPSLGNLLENHSMGRQGGGTLLGPLFNGGATYFSVKQAEARTKEMLLNYENVVLNAFREVNDSLVTIQNTRERITHLAQQVEVLEKSLTLTKERYKEGIDDSLVVLDADRHLFTAQLELASARTEELTATVQLYKALGGGWQVVNEKGENGPLINGEGKIAQGPGASAENP